jgi:hypothetical protein
VTVDDRQETLIGRMLAALRASRAGTITYERLAADLDAHFVAGEFTDQEFRTRFYDLWAPLEEAWDTKAGDVNEPLVREAASEFEAVLMRVPEDDNRRL